MKQISEEKGKKFKYNKVEVKIKSNQDDDDQTQIIFDPKLSIKGKSKIWGETGTTLYSLLLSYQRIEVNDLIRSMNWLHVHEDTQRDKLE